MYRYTYTYDTYMYLFIIDIYSDVSLPSSLSLSDSTGPSLGPAGQVRHLQVSPSVAHAMSSDACGSCQGHAKARPQTVSKHIRTLSFEHETPNSAWWFGTFFYFPLFSHIIVIWTDWSIFQKGWHHQPELHGWRSSTFNIYIYIIRCV